MSKNSSGNKPRKRINNWLTISDELLAQGYFNEVVMFCWMIVREILFLKLEDLKIPYNNTTDAIFNLLKVVNARLLSKNIIFFYHIGIMAEWDRNLVIEKEEAFEIFKITKQIYIQENIILD